MNNKIILNLNKKIFHIIFQKNYYINMDRTKYKVDREKFKTGCIAIFRRWTAFRMALDQNPQILNYITKDNTIEINDFLEILYDDILTTITNSKYGMKELIQDVAECLNYFIGDYFKIELADNSDMEIAEVLIKLHNELKDGKEKMLNNLISLQNKISQKYSVEFPITGKQIPPKKKDESDDNEDDEEGEEEEDEKESKKENKKENKKKEDDKKKIDEPDEDGFVVVRKGKKGF